MLKEPKELLAISIKNLERVVDDVAVGNEVSNQDVTIVLGGMIAGFIDFLTDTGTLEKCPESVATIIGGVVKAVGVSLLAHEWTEEQIKGK